MLFSDGKKFRKYLSCILIGIPLWFVVGVAVALGVRVGVGVAVALGVGVALTVVGMYLAPLRQINFPFDLTTV